MSHLDRYPCSRSRLVVWSVRVVALALVWVALLVARPALAQETWFVDAGVDDGLVAHWRFDENASTETFVREFVGTAHGTVSASGGLVSTPAKVIGLPNNGIFYANATRYITVTHTSALEVADQFTLSAWVRRDDNSDPGLFEAIYDSGQQANEWWIYVDGSNRLGMARRPSPHWTSTGTIVADGTYHHIAVVKTAIDVSFYIDGVFKNTVSVVGTTLSTPSGAAHIGALFDPDLIATTVFDGHIDDLRLYDSALSTPEVEHLAGKGETHGHGCATDGKSWATAFRELQCALADAAPGDDIVIAKGIYYPGVNRFSNFNVENNLHLYGGYTPGDPELPRPVMSLKAFPEEMTILSGDIDRNDDLDEPDMGDRHDGSEQGTYGGNSMRVIHLSAADSTLLQGLQVRGGNANHPSSVDFAKGGGMHAFAGSSATLVNVSFFKNKSRLDGGGIYAEGSLYVTGSDIRSNQAPVELSGGGGGGGIFVLGTLLVTRSSFSDNFSDMPGGAIRSLGPATIVGSEFGDNSVDTFFGGAISAAQTLTVTGSNFVGGFAPFGGGAIYLDFGAISGLIENTTFESNTSDGSGGAIDSQGVPLIVRNSTFLNNHARARGGAIDVAAFPTTTLLVEDSSFTGNQALGLNCIDFQHICTNGEGGAIASSATGVIRRSTFTGNFSVRNGGAIILQAGGTILPTLIEDSTFAQNVTSNPAVTGIVNSGSGGAIFTNSPLVVRGTTFTGNFSSIEGGAIRSYRFDTNDDAANEERTWLDVADSKFISNTSINGGAIALIANANIRDSIFSENQIDGSASGAALSVYTEFVTTTLAVTVTNNVFSKHEQGAVYAGGSSNATLPFLIANNLFLNNSSPVESEASDIFDEGPQTQILHNTFVRSNPGDFASIVSAAPTVIRNNIFYFDPAISPRRPALRDSTGTAVIESHNLFFNANIRDIFEGTITSQGGTVTADPLFADQAAGNFHLTAASPARNAGTATSVTLDFEGDVRPIGSAVDMGYDEARFVPPVITPPANAFTLINQPANFPLGLFVDSDDDGVWQITIDWGDGTANTVFNQGAVGAIPPQSHTYTAADVYDVTITVRDGAGLTHQVTFQVTAAPPPTPTPTATATLPGNPATATPTPPANPNYLPAIMKP